MHSRRAAFSFGLAVVLLPCLILTTAAQGGPPPPPTNILYGFVTTNRTLTYGYPGPVYYLPGDLVVNPGITLTIEPGVTLLFPAGKDTLQGGDYPGLGELIVQGTVSAVGSLANPINFASTGSGSSQWGQLKVTSSGSLTLHQAYLSGASTVLLSDGALDIASVTATATQNGMVFNVGATGHVSDSRLVGTGTGIGLLIRSGNLTAAPDSTSPRPCDVSGFAMGVQTEGATQVSHIVAHDNGIGFYMPAGYGGVTFSYITSARNTNYGVQGNNGGTRVYSAVITNNPGCGICVPSNAAFANYVDSWSNSSNFSIPAGPFTASYNPFYVSYAGSDFRLTAGSPFKTYGPWGAEIGAYGPGPGAPTPATPMSWGRIKASYR